MELLNHIAWAGISKECAVLAKTSAGLGSDTVPEVVPIQTTAALQIIIAAVTGQGEQQLTLSTWCGVQDRDEETAYRLLLSFAAQRRASETACKQTESRLCALQVQ